MLLESCILCRTGPGSYVELAPGAWSLVSLTKELEELFPDFFLSVGVASKVVPAHHQLVGLGEEGVVSRSRGRGEGQVDEVAKSWAQRL
jgi:hypothetical protein